MVAQQRRRAQAISQARADHTRAMSFHEVCADEKLTRTLFASRLRQAIRERTLETQDRWGDTALHCLCQNPEATPRMLKALADAAPLLLKVRDGDGRTPLEYKARGKLPMLNAEEPPLPECRPAPLLTPLHSSDGAHTPGLGNQYCCTLHVAHAKKVTVCRA
eukprot:COSAG05_NODE_977_length_6332_cov_10.027755_9_plen_162_part_00